MEVHEAGPERGRERLDVEPANHQDATVRHVLDDAHDEASLVPADGGRVKAGVEIDRTRACRARRRRHTTTARPTARTGSPAAAIAALASAIETSRRWKTPAAR